MKSSRRSGARRLSASVACSGDATAERHRAKGRDLRAIHQRDTPPIFVDSLAERILGPDAAALIATHGTGASNNPRLRGTLAARGVIAEETITDAVRRGVMQCVILGAGLDTFAYRHAHDDLQVFETDHPASQAWKRDALRSAGIAVPASVRYVAADLEHDDLMAALASADFEAKRPAIFTLLGVTPYLARDTTLKLLNLIAAGCAPRSEIVFDYTEPYANARAPIGESYEAAARVAAEGEPWISLFEPALLADRLRALGFREIEDIDAAALHQRFCAGRTDGLTIAALVHLVRARL